MEGSPDSLLLCYCLALLHSTASHLPVEFGFTGHVWPVAQLTHSGVAHASAGWRAVLIVQAAGSTRGDGFLHVQFSGDHWGNRGTSAFSDHCQGGSQGGGAGPVSPEQCLTSFPLSQPVLLIYPMLQTAAPRDTAVS